MKEDNGESGTPFWVQGNTGGRRGDGVRRRVESAVFSSRILVFLLVVAAVFFMVFVLPSMASFTSVFGVLSRSKNELQKSNPRMPVWYGYRDEGQRSNPAGHRLEVHAGFPVPAASGARAAPGRKGCRTLQAPRGSEHANEPPQERACKKRTQHQAVREMSLEVCP
nr:formin-like protein 20 [Ipomoea batatas]